MSVLHQIPLGGENLLKYQGPARLVRADGTEWFGTMSDGEETFEHPLPGEVIWRDDEGVTCRIWNWRQARRTQLESDTISALFIFDALDPIDDEALGAAGDELIEHLTASSPHLIAARRMIGGGTVES
jgi:DNA/RNA-binding domain of Phe-tRNA-synthetase-like protein